MNRTWHEANGWLRRRRETVNVFLDSQNPLWEWKSGLLLQIKSDWSRSIETQLQDKTLLIPWEAFRDDPGIRSFRQRLVRQRLRSIRQRPKSFRQRLTGQFANVSYPVLTKKSLLLMFWNPKILNDFKRDWSFFVGTMTSRIRSVGSTITGFKISDLMRMNSHGILIYRGWGQEKLAARY